MRLSLPALGNDVSWSVAFSMYSVILGHLGTDAVAANSLVVVVRNIGTVFCFAIASAGSVLLGNIMERTTLAMAKQNTVPILRTTTTSELAATASVPRCPRITEYMENATLQDTSFPSAGRDRRMKSCVSTLL